MSDFLLELRCEEIPARMQAGARAELVKLFRREIEGAGVTLGDVTLLSTPRRLALIARDLPAMTEAVSEEAKGPPQGAPDQAVDGFCRKNGVARDQLELREVKGRATYFAVIEKPGRAVADVLAEAIPAIIRDFSWPKSMRWGAPSLSTESPRWVRPLSGIIALFDGTVVECSADSIAAGRMTKGHRFHHTGDVEISDADSYAEQLREAHVIVDHEERQDIVRTQAATVAQAAGLTLMQDEGLVIENAGLTEWPVPLLGRFDETYLDVPPEVIQLTARVNQKYFVCEDAGGQNSDGKLANAFICTANIAADDGGSAIVDGNRKVLAARLSDARFFWDVDRKKTLAEHAKGLERITFHEKLGTVADKVERVAKLARWLVETGVVEGADPELAEQAAKLCKADLVTEMVGEFPELQGLMGGYYARAEGLDDEIADAIRDHYKPVGQGDDVPTAPVTVAVSLADKLDTLAGFFGDTELRPTGSRDPFALRRATIGVLRTIALANLRMPIGDALESWFKHFASNAMGHRANAQELLDGGRPDLLVGKVKPFLYQSVSSDSLTALETAKSFDEPIRTWLGFENEVDWRGLDLSFTDGDIVNGELEEEGHLYAGNYWFTPFNSLLASLLDFFADRLKVQQKEAGVRHDLIDAVFATKNADGSGEDDLVRLLARVHALQACMESEDGANLHAGYKRAANILKKEGRQAVPANSPAPPADDENSRTSYIPEPTEKALRDALDAAEPMATTAIEEERFEDAMSALSSLRVPIDAFFDEVTVNDPDPVKRAARLDLLEEFRQAVHKVANFAQIEG